ncbi:MAG: DUF2793 domain-containing protein [Pseudomonadota bacterium]
MPDATPILSLPLILPAQAQKHVTHNEALRLLDILVQLAVLDTDRVDAPATPDEGHRHIVAAGATGLWAGQDTKIAAFWGGSWVFVTPLPGWTARVLADSATLVFQSGAWVPVANGVTATDRLGINAVADTTNRLTVAAAATLLTHAGAGHQLKLNKATEADTGSLLFQTGYSGRAELGLAGGDDFSVKVSDDGTTFTTALTADAATGVVGLPQGLVLGGSISGSAVTQSPVDDTVGRITRVGDFGLGGPLPAATTFGLASIGDLTSSSFVTTTGASDPQRPEMGNFLGLHTNIGYQNNAAQFLMGATGSNAYFRGRSGDPATGASVWSPWRRLVHSGNLIGTVSQTSGAPTGAVIERGSNANGQYTRFADGLQICTSGALTLPKQTVAGLGYLCEATWTFPASFVAAPNTTMSFRSNGANLTGFAGWTSHQVRQRMCGSYANTSVSAFSTIVGTVFNQDVPDGAMMTDIRAIAIGRWF